MHKLLAKYLFNEASEKEREQVEQWLGESESNRLALQALRERITLATSRYRPDTFIAGRAMQAICHSTGKRTLRTLFARYAAAALVIILLGGGLLYYFLSRPMEMITVCSNTGQTLVVRLPDSTTLTLSELSEVRYPVRFTGKQREVKMSGKIFFKVHRDTAHPFIIQTPSIGVAVLGTSFQVSATEAEANVLVKKGKVAVSSPDGMTSDTLTTGMASSWKADSNKLTKSSRFDYNLLAWKTKKLRFHDTPLPKVIEELNNYYHVHIILPESYKKLRLTATFKDVNLSRALEIINQTLDIHLTAPAK